MNQVTRDIKLGQMSALLDPYDLIRELIHQPVFCLEKLAKEIRCCKKTADHALCGLDTELALMFVFSN